MKYLKHLPSLLIILAPLSALHADVVAVDGAVPSTMDAGGVLGNPAEYITGNTGVYNHAFGNVRIYTGSAASYNQWKIQSGSEVSSNRDLDIGFGDFADSTAGGFNSIVVTGNDSSLKVEGSYKITVGYRGSGNSLSIENGGAVSAYAVYLGYGNTSQPASSFGSNNNVTVRGAGSTLTTTSSIQVGIVGGGNTLNIEGGGKVESQSTWIGSSFLSGSGPLSNGNNGATVSGPGSSLTNSGELEVGHGSSKNTLVIENGGTVSNAAGRIGTQSAGADQNEVIVNGIGSSWTNTSLTIGSTSSENTLIIADGGAVISTTGTIGGGSNSNHNSVTITGEGSTWTNTGNLTIGGYGSDNSLTIADGALVKLRNNSGLELSFSTLGSSSDNFLRLDGGYIALFGDEVSLINQLLGENLIQRWNGSEWVSAFGSELLSVTFYANDPFGRAGALAATGYDNLGGYTVVSVAAVPEPTTWALLGLGASAWLLRRKDFLKKA